MEEAVGELTLQMLKTRSRSGATKPQSEKGQRRRLSSSVNNTAKFKSRRETTTTTPRTTPDGCKRSASDICQTLQQQWLPRHLPPSHLHPQTVPPPPHHPPSNPNNPNRNPAFRAFINRISETVANGLSQRRPWAELDRSALSKPESISEAAVRIRKNYSYSRSPTRRRDGDRRFSLVTHPLLAFLLCLLASWLFLYLFRPSDQPVVILSYLLRSRDARVLDLVQHLRGFPHGCWICSRFGCDGSGGSFLDEQEPAATGFLSFLGGAASSAAPVIAARG
ncbi:hypothetical protein Bca52824_003700 [Brassica carinata]|uniref:Uncharacterized protein n=1 Tax=Brassica carinata TaxID=52824 RepID=A0A8X7WPB1_BRACI|nr:hypothetical protein Bca52824_003700 [Brassica carinata]